jgi:predicted transcriptional regulator
VTESVAESPGTSIRHRSQQLDIPRSTMQRILTKDVHLHAYKIQLTQELNSSQQTNVAKNNLLAVSSHAMAIRIGHRSRAI